MGWRPLIYGQLVQYTRWKKENADRETFEIAMLIVNRKEKVTRTMLSRRESCVKVKVPRNIKRWHPIDPEPVWRAVSSHGYANYLEIRGVILGRNMRTCITFPSTALLYIVNDTFSRK